MIKDIKLKKVNFRLHSPDAKEVFLVGDFSSWDKSPVKMRKHKDGTFKISVPLISELFHHYKFKRDGEWIMDPASSRRSMNGYGGHNSVIYVD